MTRTGIAQQRQAIRDEREARARAMFALVERVADEASAYQQAEIEDVRLETAVRQDLARLISTIPQPYFDGASFADLDAMYQGVWPQ